MVIEAQAGNRYNFHVHEYHIKICGLCTILIAADGAGQKLTSDQTLHLKHLQIHKNPWDFMLWRSPQSLDQLWRSLGWSSPVTRPLNVGSYKLQENADCIFYSWKWQVLEEIKKKPKKTPNGTDSCCVAIPTEWRHPGALVLSRDHMGTGLSVHSSGSQYKARCPNNHWQPKNSAGFGSQHSEEICFLSHQFPAFFW